MAWAIQMTLDIGWIGEGSGGASFVARPQANIAGYGSTPYPGVSFNAQTIRFQQAEQVIPTASPPTQANFQSAVTSAATDLNSQLTAAVVAVLQGWASGNP